MRELPLNGRNFEQLIVLSPGVQSINAFSASSYQGNAPEYSIAGARPTGQAIQLDDENLQGFWNKGIGSITGSSLGIEAIGEFQTLTNTYGAQFGGNGALINAVSKSGTNSFHGSAYEFLRNSAMDARNFFDPHTIPEFRRNQFGGSAGGPVKKNKAFFFVNYEGIRQQLGETEIATVPTAGARTVTSTNRRRLAPLTRHYVYPLPANLISSTLGQVTEVAGEPAHENYVLGRFDYTLCPTRIRLFVRYFSDKADLCCNLSRGMRTLPFSGRKRTPRHSQVHDPRRDHDFANAAERVSHEFFAFRRYRKYNAVSPRPPVFSRRGADERWRHFGYRTIQPGSGWLCSFRSW